jgi:hypothetical protein
MGSRLGVMTVEAFGAAAEAFTKFVHRIPADAWNGPGLGAWDLRALVGHASRSLVTVSTYLRTTTDRRDATSAADYYVRIADFATAAGTDAILERGRQAGRDLGDDPAVTFAELARRAVKDVAAADDPLIEVIGGIGIRLHDYLPTRTFELAVHGLDAARATGIPFDLPATVLTTATTLAAEIAVATGRGSDVLLALTGRTGLPDGFSIV